MQVGKVYNRRKIMELPYKEFTPGKLWCPTFPTSLDPPLVWTTVLIPEQLSQIESEEEYLLLLTRRVEWLIQEWIDDWMANYDQEEDLEVKLWIVQEIEQYLPLDLQYLNPSQSPREMASYLITNYWNLQQAALNEQQFPVSPPPKLETDLNLLREMNLMDWLAFMNTEANPHNFQD